MYLAGRMGPGTFEDGPMYFMNAPFFGTGGRQQAAHAGSLPLRE